MSIAQSHVPITAVLTMCLGMALIPLGDTGGKMLVTDGVSPGFVAASRFAIGALVLLPFVSHGDLARILRDWRIWLRGALLAMAVTCILTALRSEPLANVFGAFFVGPIISYALSVWLLREPFAWPRFGLVVIGFCGVLLIVRPSFEMTQGLVWAVMAGMFYGGFLTASRWLSATAPPLTLLASQLLIAALILSPAAWLGWPALDGARIGWTALSAGASTLGNLLLIMAYRQARATVLAPFVYAQLVSALGLGWLIFGDWPDSLALLGLSVLMASGLASACLPQRRR